MKNKTLKIIVITTIILTIFFIIFFSVLCYLFNEGILFIPFKSDKISFISDNKDYKKIINKKITKIDVYIPAEFCSNELGQDEIITITNTLKIQAFLDKIGNFKGNRISSDKLQLGPKHVTILLHSNDISLSIKINTLNILINNSYYYTSTNYTELLT